VSQIVNTAMSVAFGMSLGNFFWQLLTRNWNWKKAFSMSLNQITGIAIFAFVLSCTHY
jgi:hypothetical protein